MMASGPNIFTLLMEHTGRISVGQRVFFLTSSAAARLLGWTIKRLFGTWNS